MQLTAAQLRRMAIGKPDPANLNSVLTALNQYGKIAGLEQPHRIAQYLSQLLHESGSFRFDREVWGPTPAQKRYEGRKELGNTQKGDGKKFAGHGPIQITGRANTKAFYDWCVKNFPQLTVPDFVKNPKLINTDPWEGLTGIWYWQSRNLNRYADQGDIEMITKRINGGLNGYADRLMYYDRVALVLLDFKVGDIAAFQRSAKATGDYDGQLDGLSGPRTRAAMHRRLVKLTDFVDRSGNVASGPVVDKEPVVVANEELEKPWWQSFDGIERLLSGGALTALAGFFSDWRVVAVVGGVLVIGGSLWFLNRERQRRQLDAKMQAELSKALV